MILLHIGMTKAGSSALQAGLDRMRGHLSTVGVLYPEGPANIGHSLLAKAVAPPERIPRGLRQWYDDNIDAIELDLQRWLATVRHDATVGRPRLIILSEESLFNFGDVGNLSKLGQMLRWLSDKVEVVVYVRRPSDHYLSQVQQVLKASHKIPAPVPVSYRRRIERYSTEVADKLHVIKYDRDAWPQGDILRHFISTFVPEATIPRDHNVADVNTSISAEALAIIADYRLHIWPHQHNRFTADTNHLINILTQLDTYVGGTREARLREEVRRHIDTGSADLLWLRDEHGVVFDGIDYGDVRKASGTIPRPTHVNDICHIDVERHSELTARLIYTLMLGVKGAGRHTIDEPRRRRGRLRKWWR